MGYKHTSIYTHFQGIYNKIYGFGRLFLLLNFFTRPPPVHPYIYPSIFVFTHQNDRWTGLYINLLWSATFYTVCIYKEVVVGSIQTVG